ncbi:MAG: hypothetical protein H6835_19860 [Planctomycetes bacterium]|nr:hypothetical protein [Planctomycetota bacterium]
MAPLVATVATSTWFVLEGLSLFRTVGRGGAVNDSGLLLAAAALLCSLLLVVTVEVLREAGRYRAPEQTLRLAMQRIRAGDVGFRVGLRRGDPLTGLARECNELLEWLNVNRPPGVRGGGDIVEVAVDDEEPVR